MKAHQSNSLTVAEFLENHPKISYVHYPGLSSHPQHYLARLQIDGFGGKLSFELKGGAESVGRMMNVVRLCSLAVSLGAAETLIEHPASMTHASISCEERKKVGIKEGLVHLSVGLEEFEDILEDLKRALGKA